MAGVHCLDGALASEVYVSRLAMREGTLRDCWCVGLRVRLPVEVGGRCSSPRLLLCLVLGGLEIARQVIGLGGDRG